MTDISGLYGTHKLDNGKEITVSKKGSNLDLDMTDFISLMIVQMTNQGIDDSMDTSEMLNQMVQMQMITSMVNMTDAVTMNYAASLVGKEVTLGVYNEQTKKIEEVYGTVEASGTYDGRQVIFVDGKSYFLSDIMAVGKLPPIEDEKPPAVDGEGDEDGDGTDGVEKPDGSGGADGDSDSSTDGTDSDNSVDGTDEAA